jgi:fibronectin-binding autotransporter adhesin
MNRFLKMFCFFALASLTAVLPLHADPQTWVGGGGANPQAFGDPLNWTPGGTLASTDALTITTSTPGLFPIISDTDPNGQYPTTDNTVGSIEIGSGALDGMLEQDSGNCLVTGGVRVGSTTSGSTLALTGGIFNQTGGDNVVGFEGKTGTLALSGTAAMIYSGPNMWVGLSGAGSIGNVSISETASLTTNNNLWIGAGQTGYLTMNGGTLTSNANWVLVGNNGYGGPDSNGYGSVIADGGAQIVLNGGGMAIGVNDNGTTGGHGDVTLQGTSSLTNNTGTNFYLGYTGTGTVPSTLTLLGTAQVNENQTGGGGGGRFIIGRAAGTNATLTLGVVDSSTDNPTFTIASTSAGVIGDAGSNVTVNINSGTFNGNSTAYIGFGYNGATVNWNQNGGLTNLPSDSNPFIGCGVGSQVTISLNGGTFATPRIITDWVSGISPTVTVNFNGGTLQANASDGSLKFIDMRSTGTFVGNVQAGGAVIDTNGYTDTLKYPLVHDSLLGTDPDGGLTKLGAGNLVLSAQSTYTGSTVVNDGTLQLQPTPLVMRQEAYTAPGTVSTRADGPYALGRNFTANTPIQVTQLGVFDDSGDGLAATHVVHLTNTSDMSDTTVTLTPEASGTYQNGYTFITLDTPLSLNAGNYLIWVDGLGGTDRFSDYGHGMSISYDLGAAGEITLGNPVYDLTVGVLPTNWWDTGANGEAAASFIYYNPASVILADLLPTTTPVVLGGAAGSTPTLDLQGASQQIASLADVAGAEVLGVVTNSATETPVVLTLGATSDTTTYSGSIDGNLSLVKSGASTQILAGPLTYTGDTTVDGGILDVASLTASPNVTVNNAGSELDAGSITTGTLTIGSGAKVVIRASAGLGAASGSAPQPVPEPSSLILLTLAGLGILPAAWRRKS